MVHKIDIIVAEVSYLRGSLLYNLRILMFKLYCLKTRKNFQTYGFTSVSASHNYYSFIIMCYLLRQYSYSVVFSDDGKKVMLDVEGKTDEQIYSEMSAVAGKTE